MLSLLNLSFLIYPFHHWIVSVNRELINTNASGHQWLTTTRFCGFFWVDVSTSDLAESTFLDITSRLQISAQTWEDGQQVLANSQYPWLLVLDNADDSRVAYQRCIPAGHLGMVMLASRNEECCQYPTQKCIMLDGLSDDEACELLLRAAHVPRDRPQILKDDVRVAALLRSHPLALIQAGSYVSRGHCILAEYPRVFAQQRQRLLAFRPTQAQSRYQDVYATFELPQPMYTCYCQLRTTSITEAGLLLSDGYAAKHREHTEGAPDATMLMSYSCCVSCD